MKKIKLFEEFAGDAPLDNDKIGRAIFFGSLKNSVKIKLGKFIKKLFGDLYNDAEIDNLISGYEGCIIEYSNETMNSDKAHYARLISPDNNILFTDKAPKQHGGFMRVTRLIPLITDNKITNEDVRKALDLNEEWPLKGSRRY